MPNYSHSLFLLYKLAEIIMIITIITKFAIKIKIRCLFKLFIYPIKNLQHFSLIRLYVPNHTSKTFFQLPIEILNQITLITILNAQRVILL